MFTDGASRFSTTAAAQTDDLSAVHEPETRASDSLDDVFGGDSDDEYDDQSQLSNRFTDAEHRNQDISEVPRLRSTHTTNGYREGLSTGKEQYLQEGFDEGYSLGAEIGAAAGRLIGILEALVVAIHDVSVQAEVVQKLEGARTDLSVKNLYAPEYFGAEDGIWRYTISDEGENEEDVTFRVVASRHPLIVRWSAVVNGLLEEYGLTSMPA
jgi:hypothetical protein